jgi:O-acetyl-ADP-ribose deacetylase
MGAIRRNDATVECRQGDIADQPDIDAIVNAANAQLRPGGGVAGAIHRAAGPGLDRECRLLAPIRPGQAVITGAHDLPNRYVIHCLGPVFGRDEPAAGLLSDCYRNALALCRQHGIRSVAFPAVSTGVFGYPLEDAARVAFKTVFEGLATPSPIKLVRLVLFSAGDLRVCERVLSELTPDGSR